MKKTKSIAEWMREGGIGIEELVESSALDRRIVEAIAAGRYTPSPGQRQRLADALEIPPEAISWGHLQGVEHMYGHGPQFGRSP